MIAANYAFSLGAGLCLVPDVPDRLNQQLLEEFYSVYENRTCSVTKFFERLTKAMRDICGPLPVEKGGSITFITSGLPYGFAFCEAPSTHLFKYPDLGLSVVNGFAAQQPDTRGIGVAVLVDPETTDAPEIEAATELLSNRRIFVRG